MCFLVFVGSNKKKPGGTLELSERGERYNLRLQAADRRFAPFSVGTRDKHIAQKKRILAS